MPQNALRAWENRFRRDAAKDNMTLLRQHLQRIGLPDEPEALLEGTIRYLRACCAYLHMDGRPIDEFLAMQSYHPALDADSLYSFTINLLGRTFGRIITPLDGTCLDLADLYGHPWYDLEMCGYSDFRVARLDGEPLSEDEITALEEAITDDIRFDYCEDEVGICMDEDTISGVLVVSVNDIIPEDQDS